MSDELDRLKAENARLRELVAENAKLRELVRDTYESAAFWIDHFRDGRELHKRMRELGIEWADEL